MKFYSRITNILKWRSETFKHKFAVVGVGVLATVIMWTCCSNSSQNDKSIPIVETSTQPKSVPSFSASAPTSALIKNRETLMEEALNTFKRSCTESMVQEDCYVSLQKNFKNIIQYSDIFPESIDRKLFDLILKDLKCFNDATNTINTEVEPAVIEKPIPPNPESEYRNWGSFQLGGIFRGNYNEGGVVIKSGDKYYLIKDVNCINGFGNSCSPNVYMNAGYVKDTGQIIILNIGKYGESAIVVKPVDVETYEDDQKLYQETCKSQAIWYQNALKEYQKYLNDLSKFKAEHNINQYNFDKASQNLNKDLLKMFHSLQK